MKLDIDKIYAAFVADFWSKSCCGEPCSNTLESDDDYLEGAKALYEFLKREVSESG